MIMWDYNRCRVFKKGTYEFHPFVIYDKTLDDTYEITLSEYGSTETLGCGFFKMKNNSFDLTYPNDEVCIVLKGEVDISAGGETVHLKEGDVFQVKEGLSANLKTDKYVEIFFSSYPVVASEKGQ
jgi:ethanolamine utilization protein EutQ (cupin superfamily)